MNRQGENRPVKQQITSYIRTHKHVLMFLYFPIYLMWFFVLEKLIVSNYWVSYIPLDDKIPFIPAFILPYVLWFPNIILPAFVLYFKNTGAFKRYAWYVIISFSLSMLICMVFPNGQNLRPVLPEQKDFFTAWVSMIYAADTNTNVLPSMHVVGCMGAAFAAWDIGREKPVWRRWRIPALALEALISISTVFVKQHSVLDIIAGVLVGVLVGWPIYRKGSPLRRTQPPKETAAAR